MIKNKINESITLGLVKGMMRSFSILSLLFSPLIFNLFFGTEMKYGLAAIFLDLLMIATLWLSFMSEEFYIKMSSAHFKRLNQGVYKSNFVQGLLVGVGAWTLFFIFPIKWIETINNGGAIVWVGELTLLDFLSFVISFVIFYVAYKIEARRVDEVKEQKQVDIIN